MVGEHLNEATISRLGSILECGNMLSHPDCRATLTNQRTSKTMPKTEADLLELMRADRVVVNGRPTKPPLMSRRWKDALDLSCRSANPTMPSSH
jgi:hypothetical protein